MRRRMVGGGGIKVISVNIKTQQILPEGDVIRVTDGYVWYDSKQIGEITRTKDKETHISNGMYRIYESNRNIYEIEPLRIKLNSNRTERKHSSQRKTRSL